MKLRTVLMASALAVAGASTAHAESGGFCEVAGDHGGITHSLSATSLKPY